MRYACGKSATLPMKVLIESRYTPAATATPTGESTANRSPSTTAALRPSAPTPPASAFEIRATTAPSTPVTVPTSSANRTGSLRGPSAGKFAKKARGEKRTARIAATALGTGLARLDQGGLGAG